MALGPCGGVSHLAEVTAGCEAAFPPSPDRSAMSVDPAVIHASARAGATRYPFSSWHPLPENATQPGITPTQLILHTEASGGKASNQASWNYWARTDIVAEAHFLLDMDGDMWQAMDTVRRADNNVKSNVRAISIETQDLGGATVDVTPWTEAQLEQLAGLAAWCHLRYGIPLTPCPAFDEPGMSPHNAFPAQWSTSAHSCPGRIRTTQIAEIRSRAQAIVEWTPPAHLEDTQTPTTPIAPQAKEPIMYTILTAAGKVPALTAIDGSGITQIGLTTEDIPKFSKAYNAPVIDIDPNVWQDINNKSKSDISPGA